MTPPVAPYSVASETSATRLSDVSQNSAAEVDEHWAKVLDKFIEWGTQPEDFIEEGFTPPSGDTISLACQHVVIPFRKMGRVPPSQVVPDTHGGIVFERRDNGIFESIRVRADGHIEYCRFSNGKLVDRRMWL
jgi:hypothetical protein